MANRKGVFIGAYVPNELKESLRRRAAAEHRTLSQEITRILTEAIHGRNLPAGKYRSTHQTSPPRRRDIDPFHAVAKTICHMPASEGGGRGAGPLAVRPSRR